MKKESEYHIITKRLNDYLSDVVLGTDRNFIIMSLYDSPAQAYSAIQENNIKLKILEVINNDTYSIIC